MCLSLPVACFLSLNHWPNPRKMNSGSEDSEISGSVNTQISEPADKEDALWSLTMEQERHISRLLGEKLKNVP